MEKTYSLSDCNENLIERVENICSNDSNFKVLAVDVSDKQVVLVGDVSIFCLFSYNTLFPQDGVSSVWFSSSSPIGSALINNLVGQ